MAIHGYLMLTNVPAASWAAPILSEPQTIGRSSSNEIIVPAEYNSVSRRHAQIRVEQSTIYFQDLKSTGGTRLNGVYLAPEKESEVVFGDRIGLAELEMFVVAPEAKILQRQAARDDYDTLPSESSIILVGRGPSSSREYRRLRKLSPAEVQVVCWISRGLTTLEAISTKLFRSPHTIRTQLNSIYRKLRVHSREELLAWLMQNEIAWAAPPGEDGDDSERIVPLPRTTSFELRKMADDSDRRSIHSDDSDDSDSDVKRPVAAV